MEQYFVNYASLEQQRWMVADRSRTDAFAAAIAEVVRPGDVVVDVGAGTGILSLLAAKAGARRVIGIERSNMALLARELIDRNGLNDKVEIFHGDAQKLKLDEGVDVIISEWLGHMAYVEGMFRSVIQVRDAFLKPDGKLLPSAVDVMLAPVDDNELFNEYGPGFWMKKTIYGIDFSHFTQRELEMGHANQLMVPDRLSLAPGLALNHLETKTAAEGDEWCSGTLEFKIQRDGTFNGFAGWFNTQLSPGVLLDTAPAAPPTHWKQTYFPFHPKDFKAGETLKLEFQMNQSEADRRLMEMHLRVGDQEIRYHVE